MLLIAVGGTGQHVALACSRLVYLGAMEQMKCYIIDSDDGGDISKDLTSFGRTISEANADRHPLQGAHAIHSPFKIEQENPLFKNLLISQKASSLEGQLFELFFNEDSGETNIGEGMYGKPSVGATVFAQNADENLSELVAKANNEEIVIAGSFIGGTGAGMMHQLVAKLRKEYPSSRIYGIFYLPWFTPDVQKASGKHAIDQECHLRNMRHGIDYYFSSTRNMMTASALIGMPGNNYPDSHLVWKTPDAGSLTEVPHLLHLIAAWSSFRMPHEKVINDMPNSTHSFAFDDQSNGDYLLKDVGWHEDISLWERCVYARYVTRLLNMVLRSKVKKAWSDLFSDKWLTRKMADKSVMPKGLYSTVEEHATMDSWLAKQQLAESIFNSLKNIVAQYEFCTSWIEDENVLGSQQEPVRLSKVNDYASALDILGEAWAKPIQRPENAPLNGYALAQKLASKITFDFRKLTKEG